MLCLDQGQVRLGLLRLLFYDVMYNLFSGFDLPDGGEARQQAHPVVNDYEDEDGGNQGEEASALGPCYGVDEAQEPRKDGFDEVLEAPRDQAQLTGGEVGEDEDDRNSDPGRKNGVGEIEVTDGPKGNKPLCRGSRA